MLSADENLYEATRAIKAGKAEMAPIFKHLSAWVLEHTDVVILNVEYKIIESRRLGRHPRLKLVVESASDWEKICDKNSNIKHSFKKFLLNTFSSLVGSLKLNQDFELANIEVAAENFSEIAQSLAIENILKSGKTHLLQNLSRYNIYDIIKTEKQTVLVYYTEVSQQESLLSGEIHQIRQIFADYIKEYDTYNYFEPDAINLGFDSLENRRDYNLTSFASKRREIPVSTNAEEVVSNVIPKMSFGYFLVRANRAIHAGMKRAAIL